MSGGREIGPRSARNGRVVRGYRPGQENRALAGFLACAGHCIGWGAAR